MKRFDFRKIQEFRKERRMTQDQLAKKLSTIHQKICIQQVSEWENRVRGGVSTDTLLKLCVALGKSTEDFFTEDILEDANGER
jgi:transcriptional regulator with XRE-family HTH domain